MTQFLRNEPASLRRHIKWSFLKRSLFFLLLLIFPPFHVQMTQWRAVEAKSILRHSCAHAGSFQSTGSKALKRHGLQPPVCVYNLHCVASLCARGERREGEEGGRGGRPSACWWWEEKKKKKLPKVTPGRGEVGWRDQNHNELRSISVF